MTTQARQIKPHSFNPQSSCPWGKIQSRTQLFPGVWFVTTARHGGVYLSSERCAEAFDKLGGRMPTFTQLQEWLEEDCDYAIAVLLWSDQFSNQDVYNAYRTMTGMNKDYPETEYHKEWKRVVRWVESQPDILVRVKSYAEMVAPMWERGGLCTSRTHNRWDVSFYRRRGAGDREHKIVAMDYPEKQFYTTAELEALEVQSAKVV